MYKRAMYRLGMLQLLVLWGISGNVTDMALVNVPDWINVIHLLGTLAIFIGFWFPPNFDEDVEINIKNVVVDGTKIKMDERSI